MERRGITVRGIVQGVGFRAFACGLAVRHQLNGFVRNVASGVWIEVEGAPDCLDRFVDALTASPPPLARISHVSWAVQAVTGEQGFRIAASEASEGGEAADICISPDAAPCDACLGELRDPADRRYRYPFLSCTNCGPRLTIVQAVPYDRPRTAMARFPLCAACQAEYDDPLDRRFHAQANACPACGPRLEAYAGGTRLHDVPDPITWFASRLREGKIGALKGLGGFHLVCDAANEQAVCELRRRKERNEKPLAVMVATLSDACQLCRINTDERVLLESPPRPIVLLDQRPLPDGSPAGGLAELAGGARPRVCRAVAPGERRLGVMLPSTPLHQLLLDAVAMPLVMTSGNRSEEPIVYRDEDARERLRGMADVMLSHNRPIHVRCDDSVVRVTEDGPLPVRRSRGYVPQPIRLPVACPRPVLAVGGQFKAVFAIGRGEEAVLSPHIGDLDYRETYEAFAREIALYESLWRVAPRVLVHDLHPEYVSTAYALRRAEREGLRRLAVQHHHAHMASCMAEHGLTGPVIGVVFDGTGFGGEQPPAAATVWGGEFLVGEYRWFHRAAHFREVAMPGGDVAIREPWRMAAAYLREADVNWPEPALRIPREEADIVRVMLERSIHAPRTSSVGRLFDAVASLLDVRDRVHYEGQAAAELEGLAADVPRDREYAFEVAGSGSGGPGCRVVDTRPLIRELVADFRNGTPRRMVARRFHTTLAEITVQVCRDIRREAGWNRVVLSGGVFLNAVLTCDVLDRLADEGFDVYRQRMVPPSDGGLSLGQVAIATALLEVECPEESGAGAAPGAGA